MFHPGVVGEGVWREAGEAGRGKEEWEEEEEQKEEGRGGAPSSQLNPRLNYK